MSVPHIANSSEIEPRWFKLFFKNDLISNLDQERVLHTWMKLSPTSLLARKSFSGDHLMKSIIFMIAIQIVNISPEKGDAKDGKEKLRLV
jgi:hypothetical protein